MISNKYQVNRKEKLLNTQKEVSSAAAMKVKVILPQHLRLMMLLPFRCMIFGTNNKQQTADRLISRWNATRAQSCYLIVKRYISYRESLEQEAFLSSINEAKISIIISFVESRHSSTCWLPNAACECARKRRKLLAQEKCDKQFASQPRSP